jgi:hypothetical protein
MILRMLQSLLAATGAERRQTSLSTHQPVDDAARFF